MAWNTPGKGSGSPKNTGNPVEDLMNRIKDGFNGRGGSQGTGPVPIIIGLVVALIAFNSFKLIDERQRAVVLRFGAYDRVMQPGANFKLPWPIETAYVVDATKIEELKQQCFRLRDELEQQKVQLTDDFRRATFEQLQTLLTSYPAARKMAEAKPEMPAKNLSALFTPLENLLSSWGFETIGSAWEQVTYNPQLHQPDVEDITEGDLVYVRFVGYRDGERILAPAKVSRTLPAGITN